MKLIAEHTIHVNREVRKPDPTKQGDKGEYRPETILPGKEFDPAHFGIGAEEADHLVDRKSARRKTREVVEEDEHEDTQRGPSSGLTGGPAPNNEAVGRNARR